MTSLEEAAAASALSPTEYLRSSLGSSVMTEEIYNAQVLRMLQYTAYVNNYTDNLTYTDDALEAAYVEDPKMYDLVSYECVTVSGTANPPPTRRQHGLPHRGRECRCQGSC